MPVLGTDPLVVPTRGKQFNRVTEDPLDPADLLDPRPGYLPEFVSHTGLVQNGLDPVTNDGSSLMVALSPALSTYRRPSHQLEHVL